MDVQSFPIATPLSWLKGEIDRSLRLARTALARGAAEPAPRRSQALLDCALPVRHIRGALEMLRLQGAARFCTAVEQAIERFAGDPVRLNELTASVVDRALFALSQFLDDLAKGEPDVPLKLFPVYRELCACGGREDAAEIELFFPDVTAAPARAHGPEVLEGEERARHLATWRTRFQRGLVAWLKDADDIDALHAMRDAVEAIDQIGDRLATPAGLWWVAAGLIDLLLNPDPQTQCEALQPLLLRLERLMRSLGAAEPPYAGDLLREMLYPIALAGPVSTRVREIKSAYKLDAQFPEFCVSGTLEYDVGALAPVLDQMQQKLVAMEEAWARYTDGSGEDLKRLRTQVGALKAIARDLGHYRMVRLLDIVGLIAQKLPETYPADNDVLALEMAAALLFMESMLDHFTSPPADIDQQVAVMVGWLLDALKPRGLPLPGMGAPRDDITQRQHYTEVRAQVAREILANLQRIEHSLEAIARDADAASRIGTLEPPMRQIAGALKMLGLNRANGVLSACLHLMKLSAGDDPALTRAALEWVADGLSCLGFYLENVCHGETPNESILLGFVQRLSREDAHAAGSTGWVPPARPDPHDDDAMATAGPDAAPPAEAAESASGSEASDLRAVYLEEAGGILSDLRAWSGRLRNRPDDAGALTEVRRGFHTLKGSARVVGLEPEANLAWEVEQTLNAALKSGLAASDELLVLVDEAAESFASMLEARGRGLEPQADAHANVAGLAAALRADESAATGEAQDAAERPLPAGTSEEAQEARCEDGADASVECAADADAPQSAADADAPEYAADAGAAYAALPRPVHTPVDIPEDEEEIAIGEVRLSATLYRIYRDECATLLETIGSELARLAAEPAMPVPDALLRAAHTLHSTSNTLGFEPVARLAGAFEEALQRVQAGPVAAPRLTALETAAGALAAMLDAIRRQRAPSRDPHAEQALYALGMTGEPGAPGPNAQADRAQAASGNDAQLAALVREEAAELLARAAAELSRWRALPWSIEPPRAMTHALHTLKGSLRMAGSVHAAALVHALESRLGVAIRSGQADAAPFAEVAAALEQIGRSIETCTKTPGTASQPSQPPAAAAATHLGIGAATLDSLVEQTGEIGIVRLRIEAEVEGMRQAAHELADSVARLRALLRETQVEADSQMQARSGRPGGGEPGFDPLELDRYTRLQELTRMMAESLHDVQMSQQALVSGSAEAEAALALQGRVARALQQQLVGLRSLPFDALRERLARTLSQAAQALERDAELVIEGGDVELDRSLLQRLLAPLEHLLRNALAHGIETPEVRAALGKPRTGRVALRLERRGLEVELTVSDDGAGLDRERIVAAAVELGLIAAGEEPTDAALRELIFAPGLSTAPTLTESAGRGIGLDAARAGIAQLGGRIDAATTPGRGTAFHIRVPLSPASAQVLLLRAAAATYAVPSNMVDAVEELTAAALHRAYAEGSVGAYPLDRLSRLLGAGDDAAAVARHNTVVLLRSGEQRLALHVDQVLRSQEAILKPLGPQLARVPGLAGVTVLGRDEPVLVIDPLAWSAQSRPARDGSHPATARSEALAADPPHIMVVDDSLTVRRLTARLLSRAGYEVSTAKDGTDALQQMQRALPDLIVIDLEMPRMDGFELARHVRADLRAARVPIVVVTSRLAEKHQRRAADLGVDAFFGKPYAEDELLACIEDLLGGRIAARAA